MDKTIVENSNVSHLPLTGKSDQFDREIDGISKKIDINERLRK